MGEAEDLNVLPAGEPSPDFGVQPPNAIEEAGEGIAGAPGQSGRLKKRQERFLEVFAETGNISEAARITGTRRGSHYESMRESEAYRAAFNAAKEQALGALEDDLRERAKKSDLLLIFLLKSLKPERYARFERVEETSVIFRKRIIGVPDSDL